MLGVEFSEEELALAAAAASNPYLTDPRQARALLMRLAAPASAAAGDALAPLRLLIEERLPQLAQQPGLPSLAELQAALRRIVDELAEQRVFPEVANRVLVGVGGAFSAGKSHFLNALAGIELLPEGLDPCTVIPTFVGHGDARIEALTAFGRRQPLSAEELAAISHAFAQHDADSGGDSGALSQLLRCLLLTTPQLAWRNLMFIDTPGHNPPAGGDARVARRQLAAADHLLWLVSARNGGIRDDDVRFLQQLGHRQPVFFVLTQVDLADRSTIPQLMAVLAERIAAAGITCAGICTSADVAADTPGGNALHAWLSKLDGEVRYTGLRLRAAAAIARYLMHCRQCLARDRRILSSLNQLKLLASAGAVGVPAPLSAVLEEESQRLQQTQRQLQALLPALADFKTELLAAMDSLLGPLVQDMPCGAGDALLATLDAADCGGLALRTPVVSVTAIRADLKCVTAMLQEYGLELRLPFSQIRSAWGVDPLTLHQQSLLTAELRETEGEQRIFAIYYHHNHQIDHSAP